MRVLVLHTGDPSLAVQVTSGERVEAFVGEPVTLYVPDHPQAATVEFASAPQGPAPEVAASTVTLNMPGIYGVRVRCGQLSALVELIAFQREVLEHRHLAVHLQGLDAGRTRPPSERRRILRALARDLHALTPEVFALMTPERPLPAGIALQQFGG